LKDSGRLDQIIVRISELDHKVDLIGRSDEDKEKRMKKSEQNIQVPQNSIKTANIWMMGIEEEEKDKFTRSILN
jgi:glutaredoxin